MTPANNYTSNAALYHQRERIEVVAYSFSPCNEDAHSFGASKVYLDILFVHPRTGAAISRRTTMPAHLLYQPKEVIELAVCREIRGALSLRGSASRKVAA